ncbi:MAG: type II secretion system F family protein [Nitrospirae bacterium]|nr:type II secretion system F family protein [Nitrospirota bacterium]
MPIFKYIGYKEDGSEIKGTLEADSTRDAIMKIKTIGIYPKDITKTAGFRKNIFGVKRLPYILPAITRNLSTLLSSGVSMIEAVEALALEQKSQWRDILTDIKERLSAGASLARAMQAYPSIFPEFYIRIFLNHRRP